MIYNQKITHRPRATQKIFPAQTHFGYILIISLIVFPYIIIHSFCGLQAVFILRLQANFNCF